MTIFTWVDKYNNVNWNEYPINLVVLVIEAQVRPSDGDSIVFSTLNEVLQNVKAENFAVIFNKANKRTTPERVIAWYKQALKGLKSEKVKLPQLDMNSNFLII